MNDHWPELSVLQAAHAAEFLVKARIAEEHPLLVFERLPAFQKNKGALDLSLLSNVIDHCMEQRGIRESPNLQRY